MWLPGCSGDCQYIAMQLPGCCYAVAKIFWFFLVRQMQLLVFCWLQGCCYVVVGLFWWLPIYCYAVARVLLRYSKCFLVCHMHLLVSCWLPGCCYAVGNTFRVFLVCQMGLLVFCRLSGCCYVVARLFWWLPIHCYAVARVLLCSC